MDCGFDMTSRVWFDRRRSTCQARRLGFDGCRRSGGNEVKSERRLYGRVKKMKNATLSTLRACAGESWSERVPRCSSVWLARRTENNNNNEDGEEEETEHRPPEKRGGG